MIKAMDYTPRIPEHLALLDRLAARRFNNATLAEEAALFALEKLNEDNGRRLNSYDGRCRFRSYFAAVVVRLLEDFSRQRFGRKRAPAWLQRLGGLWLRLYTLLCLERYDMVAAVEIMNTRHQLSRPSSEEMAQTIKQQVSDCGAPQGQEVELTEEHGNDTDQEPEQDLHRQQQQKFFQALFHLSTTDQPLPQQFQTFPALKDLQIEINGQERMLLKLCYQDGLTVTEAGRLLGLASNQVHGKMRRLLNRLRQAFSNAGLVQEITLLLQN